MKEKFKKLNLKDGILLFDGSMGTYYRESSKKPLPECEMANLFDQDEVIRIHKEYIEAGANAIKTNTFSANTRSLNCGFDIVEKIIKNGVLLAKKSVSDLKANPSKSNNIVNDLNVNLSESEKDVCDSKANVFESKDREPDITVDIFADIGPITYKHDKVSERDRLDIFEEYKKIIDIFIDEGVDKFLFETFYSCEFLEELSDYIYSKTENPYVIVSFAINPDGVTREGYTGQELLDVTSKFSNVDAIGLNCISGPYHIFKYLKEIDIPRNKEISISPNAGFPTILNNRSYYSNSSTYYANQIEEILSMGVKIIGGCCGTTPEYISKMSKVIDKFKISDVSTYERDVNIRIDSEVVENSFLKKLERGHFPIAVELDPPSDIDIKKYIIAAKKLKDAGVDAITIADCPVGRARVDASIMAVRIKNHVGLDPIVHFTCRDRNLNATKALLLGLNIENINNLIVVTGDPIPTAERDEIKAVFNFNSRILTRYIQGLNESVFTNKMVVGGALNVNAKNFDIELKRAIKKEEAGVQVFYTQPVLSLRAVENLIKARKVLNSKIMGGIIPVVSHKNALFMKEEIAGIEVGEEIIDTYKGKTREEAAVLAVEISVDYIEKIRDVVDGIYLITPFLRVEIVEEIIKRISKR